MMRELKFRAWDKVAKKFLYPWPEGFHLLGETTCFDLIAMALHERDPEKSTLEMLNDVLIEQFTGLQDKNGKGIYEGDVLRIRIQCPWDVADTMTITGEVIWDGAGFCFRGQETGEADGHLSEVIDVEDVPCAAIGNVHENPELLKVDDA